MTVSHHSFLPFPPTRIFDVLCVNSLAYLEHIYQFPAKDCVFTTEPLRNISRPPILLEREHICHSIVFVMRGGLKHLGFVHKISNRIH